MTETRWFGTFDIRILNLFVISDFGFRALNPTSRGSPPRPGAACSRATENRANAVFRHPDRGADLLISLSFQVEKPHHLRLRPLQRPQEPLHLVLVAHPLLVARLAIGNVLDVLRPAGPSRAIDLRWSNSRTTIRRATTVKYVAKLL